MPVNHSTLYISSRIPRCRLGMCNWGRTIYSLGEDVGGSGWISGEHQMILPTPPTMKYSQQEQS